LFRVVKERGMDAVVITGLTSIVVVLLTATLAYLANRRQSLRQYQLARVDAQLSKLYGPLMALSSANARAWKQFRTVWAPDRERPFTDGLPLAEEQLALWRAWVTNVFMPANRRMREVIVDRADLLRGDTMPEQLIAFCAHVATLEELIARWDRGDTSVSTPIYAYPGASFDNYIATNFQALRTRQQGLLGELGRGLRLRR
jgi:hypothetical protein